MRSTKDTFSSMVFRLSSLKSWKACIILRGRAPRDALSSSENLYGSSRLAQRLLSSPPLAGGRAPPDHRRLLVPPAPALDAPRRGPDRGGGRGGASLAARDLAAGA